MRNATLAIVLSLLISDATNAQNDTEALVIGGQPTVEMLDSLASVGFEAILSTRGSGEINWDEAAMVDSLGMTFVEIPMEKPVGEITDQQLQQFDDFMSAGKRSFMHCGSGNRVAALWAVWLVEYEHMDQEEAFAKAEAAGMRSGMRDVAVRRLATEVPDEE
jgi:uncharacterized protein (TIGR01244 family)